MDALLAIKPKFAEKILDGEKSYEFRRTAFREAEEIDLIFLYASSPVKRILGLFTSKRVVEGSPEELWELFQDESGIASRDFLMDYFEGVETGFAIEVDETHRFEQPIDPKDHFEGYSPPMSFHYLTEEQSELLRGHVPKRFKEESIPTDFSQFQTD